MSWTAFTADHLKTGLAVRELAIYEEAAGLDFEGVIQESSGARLTAIAGRVTDQFRGLIRANPLVVELGPAGTIPSFCLPWAIAIGRVAMLGLTPVEEGRTDPRRDEYTDAIKGRDSLASMNVAAFALADPAAAAASVSSAAFGGSPRLEF